MPKLNRRNLLQMAAAAGFAPTLPKISAPALAAPHGAQHAKMLWASLQVRAGSASNFSRLAQTMGLSTQASRGIAAKVAGTQVLAAHATKRKSTQFTKRIDLKKWLTEEEQDQPPTEIDAPDENP